MNESPAHGRRPQRLDHGARVLLVVLTILAAGLCAAPLALNAGREGVAGGSLLVVLSVSMFSWALHVVVRSPVPLGRRLLGIAAAALLIAGSTALAFLVILPGPPLVHAEFESPGVGVNLPKGVAGRLAALRVRARLASESGAVPFAVAVSDWTVEGRLLPVRRELQLGGRRTSVVDTNAEFLVRGESPVQEGKLSLTKLVGITEGPVVVDLFPVRVVSGTATLVGLCGLFFAAAIAAALGRTLYGSVVAVGVVSPAFVAANAVPGAGLSPIAGQMVVGALVGVVAGMTLAGAAQRIVLRGGQTLATIGGRPVGKSVDGAPRKRKRRRH